MSGPRDFNFISPEEAARLNIDNTSGGVDHYKALAANESTCDCGQPVWKLADTGLCFSCTTGESDASDDYELEP